MHIVVVVAFVTTWMHESAINCLTHHLFRSSIQQSKMACGYTSTCCTPSCYPVGGLGSLKPSCGFGGFGGLGQGLGALGSLGRGLGGIAVAFGGSSGGGVSSSSLAINPAARVGCINQTPPSEILIQPAPVSVVIPGAILAAPCEPVRVGGYTACGGTSSVGGGQGYSPSRCYSCY